MHKLALKHVSADVQSLALLDSSQHRRLLWEVDFHLCVAKSPQQRLDIFLRDTQNGFAASPTRAHTRALSLYRFLLVPQSRIPFQVVFFCFFAFCDIHFFFWWTKKQTDAPPNNNYTNDNITEVETTGNQAAAQPEKLVIFCTYVFSRYLIMVFFMN